MAKERIDEICVMMFSTISSKLLATQGLPVISLNPHFRCSSKGPNQWKLWVPLVLVAVVHGSAWS